MKNKKSIIIIATTLITILLLGITVSMLTAPSLKDKASANKKINKQQKVYINNVEVTGLNKKESIEKLESKSLLADNKISIVVDDKTYIFGLEDVGAEFLYNEAYDKISDRKNSDSKITINEDIYIDAEIVVNKDTVKSIVEALYLEHNTDPSFPIIQREEGIFVGEEGKIGHKIDKEKSIDLIIQSIYSRKNRVTLDLYEIPPKYTIKDLNDNMTLLGTSTTVFDADEEARATNIQIASKSIDGKLVLPGEEFSTEEKFIPYTEEKGYKNAAVIVGNVFSTDIGGGVCQVSSTLYNTLLASELKVTERHNHSLKVGYADYGFDSVLAENYMDLKFVNDTEYPVFIESIVKNEEVTVNIYGKDTRADGYKVEYKKELVTVIEPPAEEIIIDKEMLEGEEEIIASSLNGYTYKVYKYTYIDGILNEKILVDTSYYRSRQGKKIIGGKKVDEDTVELKDGEIEAIETIKIEDIEKENIEIEDVESDDR